MKTKYLETLFFKQNDRYGFGLWLEVYFSEDHWFSSGDLPFKHNPHRRALFCISVDFWKWRFVMYIRYKHVGWVYFGRDLSQNKKYKDKIK